MDCEKGDDVNEVFDLRENSSDESVPCSIEKIPERDKWSSKFDFILSCVGFAVGLGNIWRFPYLCYKNGGGAFLIPYFILLVTCGVPLFLMELSLGQYMSLGNIEVWGRMVPGFQGIAFASLIIVFCLNLYYIIILSWAVYYLYMSFTTSLPWASCDNEWNSASCFDGNTNISAVWTNQSTLSNISTVWSNQSALSNISEVWSNQSVLSNTSIALNVSGKTKDSVIEFWERKVLHISDGIETPGSIVWELAVALLIVWILIYFCVWKGVRWSGKIVYFTALFPYVILTILLLRGVTLDGAAEGIKFYLKPDFSRLGDPQVWVDGGTQIFFSYAVGFGAMVTLGSYNKFNNNVYKHCFIICTVNSMTSLYGGVAVFSVLGFMANQQNVTVAEVAESGPGLVFITYPKAVTQMPASPVWAIMFFLMILFVGIDSQFVGVEGFLTPVFDMFPHILYRPKNRVLVSAIYCAVSYVIGLSMVTEGGMYVFQLFDYYSASGLVLLWVCFFEAVVIGWVFGADKFVDVIELMTGHRISVWFVICWKFILPALSLAIFLFMLIDFTPLKYNSVYEYPGAAHAFGMLLALTSMICIPCVFIYNMVKARGTLKQRWLQVTRPILNAHQIPDSWTMKDTSCVS